MCKKLGVRCTPAPWYTDTTGSNDRLPVVDSPLGQAFSATHPNPLWVTHITDVSTAEEWVYLVNIKALYMRVLGYAMGRE